MAGTLWFDVTTLWFSRGFPPDGIPRTMLFYAVELTKRAKDLRFCRYEDGRFIILSALEIEALVGEFQSAVCDRQGTFSRFEHTDGCRRHSWRQRVKSAVKGALEKLPDDVSPPVKTMARASGELCRVCLQRIRALALGRPDVPPVAPPVERTDAYPFAKGDVLFVMGFLWGHLPYDRFAQETAQVGYHVVTVIHDLIPVIYPEVCDNYIQPEHFERVIRGSSLLLAISDHTAADICAFAAARGIPAPRIGRIHWGNELSKPPPLDRPACFESLTPGKFVLYVSTVTYRKNHELLYGIWRDLYETNRGELIPLVLVGKVGALSESFLHLLFKTERLYPAYIKHFTGVNDTELAWLYANCRFTVFPSFYEGWGLPVCEAMGYGKACLSADSTSLSEACSGLAEQIPPFDYYRWKERILAYIQDDTMLREREEVVKTSYRSLTWKESADRFVSTMDSEYPGLFKKNGDT